MQSEYQALREDNKHRMRLLLEFGNALTSPDSMATLIHEVTAKPDLFLFFEEDVHNLVLAAKEDPTSVPRAVGNDIGRLLEDDPSLNRDERWRFFVELLRRSPEGWREARARVSDLKDTDREWVMETAFPWLFNEYELGRPHDFMEALSNLVQDLADRHSLHDAVAPTIEEICRAPFPRDNALAWEAMPGAAGQMEWFIRHRKTGSLETWLAGYGDLFGAAAIPDETLDNAKDVRVRTLVQRDIEGLGEPPYLENLQKAQHELKTMVVYPQELMKKHYLQRLLYGIVFVKRTSPSIALPVRGHRLDEFLQTLEENNEITVLLVRKVPERPLAVPFSRNYISDLIQ